MNYLFDMISKLDPDIIALQEITKDILKILVGTDWFHKYHSSQLFDPDFNDCEYYGNLILSKYEFSYLNVKEFDETYMSRKMIIAGIKYNDIELNIITSHLESYNHLEEIRTSQLNELVETAKKYDNVIFMGDTNFCHSREQFPDEYIDLWDVKKYGKGLTYDHNVNKMVKGIYSARLDRIYFKTNLKYDSKLELVGTKPIDGKLFPSDHFGVLCNLFIQKQAAIIS